MNKLVIVLFSLIIVAVVMVNLSITEAKKRASLTEEVATPSTRETSEEYLFRRSKEGIDFKAMPNDPLHAEHKKEYYQRRAYEGAPPQIPHPLLSKKGIGDKSCLQCHENGGYVASFKAYAPATPHPELISCRQCHVPITTKKLFKKTNWKRSQPTHVDNRALVTSPPTIPHGLQNRTDCLSCHAGSGGLVDIRATHTERANCMQCHVPNQAKLEGINQTWKRKAQ
ncbi:cytochrome c3 family protein [Flammeovirga kamogawensis]|uniref:Nitrate reductase cytochrome c-type subunit n=1 Tax=Flammeovirga kamogawensis TaxID=373891 RepID=A0ABX8H5J0_9BACT|nr:cytochrome c3 family protein [Flammeovirga kamogawensis]MBB6461933.1 cytochrome c-type protein NapB [Flammeovirga kamogawensis]QWG10460.1 nitrate reductase cytochrome c-type subunit [Flammeovirga kamogawensis]TRX63571.1 cytochrome C [Flammeovirga kamogawensis]